jgi:hypothetical protein
MNKEYKEGISSVYISLYKLPSTSGSVYIYYTLQLSRLGACSFYLAVEFLYNILFSWPLSIGHLHSLGMSSIRQVCWTVLSMPPQFPSPGKSAGRCAHMSTSKLADSQHGFADWTLQEHDCGHYPRNWAREAGSSARRGATIAELGCESTALISSWFFPGVRGGCVDLLVGGCGSGATGQD